VRRRGWRRDGIQERRDDMGRFSSSSCGNVPVDTEAEDEVEGRRADRIGIIEGRGERKARED